MKAVRVAGFDYRSGVGLALTRAQWRELLAQIEAQGGKRSAHDGETYGLDPRGHLLIEIYGNIPTEHQQSSDASTVSHETTGPDDAQPAGTRAL